jgi:hypothetical protein
MAFLGYFPIAPITTPIAPSLKFCFCILPLGFIWAPREAGAAQRVETGENWAWEHSPASQMANLGSFNFNPPRLPIALSAPLAANPPGLPYAVWASQRAYQYF